MSGIVESCPLTKVNGSLSRLHSAVEDAVSWLTNYGSGHAHEEEGCSDFYTVSRMQRTSQHLDELRRAPSDSCC